MSGRLTGVYQLPGGGFPPRDSKLWIRVPVDRNQGGVTVYSAPIMVPINPPTHPTAPGFYDSGLLPEGPYQVQKAIFGAKDYRKAWYDVVLTEGSHTVQELIDDYDPDLYTPPVVSQVAVLRDETRSARDEAQQILDGLGDVLTKEEADNSYGRVKSINGAEPDETGAIEIETGVSTVDALTDATTVGKAVAKATDAAAARSALDAAAQAEVRARTRLASAFGMSTAATAADNSAFLVSALADARTSGADLIIPAGTYNTEGVVLGPTSGAYTVRGAGRDRTILMNTHTSNPSLKLQGGTGGPYAPHVQVSDLTIQATAKNTGQVGIDVLLAVRFDFARLFVKNFDVGVRHEASWNAVYDQVTVVECNTGWLFPTTGFTPSSPMTMRNCSAITCTTGAKIDAGLEATNWIGGDFIQNATAINMPGADSRAVTFYNLNFERNTGDDVVIGDSTNGPSGVAFIGCRYLRHSGTPGVRSVHFQRGVGLKFDSCVWNNYALVMRQDTSAGTVVIENPATSTITQFMDSNGVNTSSAPLMVVQPNFPLRLAPNSLSTIRQVQASQGVATAYRSGAGKATIVDADFSPTPPPNGTLAIAFNTTDSTHRFFVRSNDVWRSVTMS